MQDDCPLHADNEECARKGRFGKDFRDIIPDEIPKPHFIDYDIPETSKIKLQWPKFVSQQCEVGYDVHICMRTSLCLLLHTEPFHMRCKDLSVI